MLRLVGWTRAQLTAPLENLKVWEGRGPKVDVVVDYISTGYLDEHLGISGAEYDPIVVRGTITKYLFIHNTTIPVFQLHSTVLFRQLQELVIRVSGYFTEYEIPILPYLEQIKRLEIWAGIVPAYPLTIDLPLTRTLQWLRLEYPSFPWMIGRSFKALREVRFHKQLDDLEIQARFEGLQVDLPACTTLEWADSEEFLRFLSCPNIQIFHFSRHRISSAVAPLKSLTNFLCHCSCLQQLKIQISKALVSWADSLIKFVLCDAREQEVWRCIRSVKVWVDLNNSSWVAGRHFFSRTVGHQQHYEKWWKKVTVTKKNANLVMINAST